MTEHEDLIARLRNHSGVQTAGVNERVALMDEAADALEKVTAERDGLSSLREQMSLRLRYVEGKREQAEAERDELAAVVEQVRTYAESQKRPHVDVAGILPILNAAPSVALDRVKAEAWEEGADATCAAYAIVRTSGYVTNPYRKGESTK